MEKVELLISEMEVVINKICVEILYGIFVEELE